MISVSGLEKSFGERVLFADAAFQLNAGERYGLVGANGSGKTTLLSILAGDLDPSDGSVSIPRNLRLGVLRQDQFLYEDQSILSVALMGNQELWQAMQEKEKLLARAHEQFDADRFGVLEETVQRHDGYTAEARAATILEGLGIPGAVHDEPLSTLSGGFKLRVLLAQVLASKPDVLLLDEPTNHLDILSIRWLEKFLADFRGPAVVISHDHRFLDNVATHILDVDYETVTLYHGNYSRFLDQKKEERERREKDIEARQKEIAHHQQFVDRFRAKASKARQAQSKLRMIEKKAEGLEALPESSRRYPNFRFRQRRPSGKEVLEVDGIRKSYGDNQVLHGVDLQVRRGDRMVIMGPNGIGKSTLLKIMVGQLEADRGDVEWGYETHPGYFAQDHHEQLEDSARTVEEWLWDFCPEKDRGWVRGHLAMMLFTGDEAEKRLSALSGGEAARLVFSRLALEQPNVLVLDEPTNHLDLESIEALVEGLREYDGTLILVSHDRWFVSQLATRVVEISATGIRDYPGTYEEYVHACGDDHLDVDEVVLKARGRSAGGSSAGGNGSSSPSEPSTRRSTFEPRPANGGKPSRAGDGDGGDGRRSRKVDPYRLEQMTQRRDRLMDQVAAAEQRIETIEQTFARPAFYDGTDPEEVQRLEEERAELQQRAAELMAEWEDVAAEVEAASS